MKIVFTNGCFDILHIGHIKLLTEAKKYGDILVVGLNSDSSVKKLKGNTRPIVPEIQRATLLSHIDVVDLVIIFKEVEPYNLIKKIKPHVLVKGEDWKNKEIIGSDIVIKNGGKIILVPLVPDISTSKIIESIK